MRAADIVGAEAGVEDNGAVSDVADGAGEFDQAAGLDVIGHFESAALALEGVERQQGVFIFPDRRFEVGHANRGRRGPGAHQACRAAGDLGKLFVIKDGQAPTRVLCITAFWQGVYGW